MKMAKKLISLAVLLIGVYMVWKFNSAQPPLMSGIAFILLGAKGLCYKK